MLLPARVWRDVGEGSGWGASDVYLLYHANVWPKPSQHCNYPPIKTNKLITKKECFMALEIPINMCLKLPSILKEKRRSQSTENPVLCLTVPPEGAQSFHWTCCPRPGGGGPCLCISGTWAVKWAYFCSVPLQRAVLKVRSEVTCENTFTV